MKIVPFGDSALLVNFEQKIDETINNQVLSLYKQLQKVKEVTFLIPAYCSLTVGFGEQTSLKALSKQIEELNKKSQSTDLNLNPRLIEIPVCYDAPYALDMNEVMEKTGLSRQKVIDTHCQETYKVYMLGFVAGFAYLGSLPKQLFCPRKTEPRKEILAGSVGLAGLQTGVYPANAPGGWQIIGRTPIPTFNPKAENPTLFKAGDAVKFKSISSSEFEEIEKQISGKTFNLEEYYG
ncbi:5-oxoprolinase subunit PxpB [Roseivirga sp.]|uniref:5-oxoprolinase subunit PxpB n=1 Tax=Roseivirga sp. TaxID=1964215 RepID=UPI002B27AEE3|nr:5-oxoprolinase subunit PxpB [Roseivirga sp.]